jgi:hypothetical protein
MSRVPYAEIPQTMRDLLDEVYTPEGVEIYWNSRNRWLHGLSASEEWKTVSGRERVQQAVEHLTGGAS